MNKLCKLLNLKNEDELFDKITTTFKMKGITQFNYFVNWTKVFKNIKSIEKELSLLNVLIGKQNLNKELADLINEYPKVINAIPVLLAIRFNEKKPKSIDILIDKKEFVYENYDFNVANVSIENSKKMADFFVNSGFGELLLDKKILNLVEYAKGVEVGLDSNGRKNRSGTMMESLVEEFVSDVCLKRNLKYIPQANAKKIKQEWGIEIKVDKSSRNVDFAINKNGKLYFIECNFYGGGGSKLKSTATEYIKMTEYWNNQGIEFIWITDGAGWQSTLKPLREYFDKADYLLNLEMLKQNILITLLS